MGFIRAEQAKTREFYSPSGIDVLIVGTGLAGLTAALECHRKHMNVRILEKNVTINTAGKTFMSLQMIHLTRHRGHVLHGT